MQKLVKGIHEFRENYFADHKQLFERLATTGQQPETLFVTCSDSRVVPNLIVNASPGELFIVRNVGNVIPRPDLPGGTAAALEYAVSVLKVDDIIVCGHTQCGAIDAILHPERMANLPFVRRWLAETERVRDVIESRYSDLSPEAQLMAAVEENVLMQLEHLRQYSFVNERLEEGTLRVSGWIFDIKSGRIFDYNPTEGQFQPLDAAP